MESLNVCSNLLTQLIYIFTCKPVWRRGEQMVKATIPNAIKSSKRLVAKNLPTLCSMNVVPFFMLLKINTVHAKGPWFCCRQLDDGLLIQMRRRRETQAFPNQTSSRSLLL